MYDPVDGTDFGLKQASVLMRGGGGVVGGGWGFDPPNPPLGSGATDNFVALYVFPGLHFIAA